jgi:flagellar motor protein MotB
MKKLKKNRHASESHAEESWAVSYADLLMVLMSFFIVFFNIDDKNEVIHKLYYSFQEELSNKGRGPASLPKVSVEERKGQGKGAGAGANGGSVLVDSATPDNSEAAEAASLSRWKELLSADEVKDGESLKIELQDNLYRPGEWRINANVKKQVDEITKLLLPLKDKVHVVIIGHADHIPFEKSTGIVNNNMILATLRAGHAVKHVIDQGLDPKWVSSMGMHEEIRDTRSLTIRITERK